MSREFEEVLQFLRASQHQNGWPITNFERILNTFLIIAEEHERLQKEVLALREEVERLKRGPVSEDGEKLYQKIKEQMRSKGYRVP